MVLLFDRLLFTSYKDTMYKITDTNTKWFIYEYKESFNSPTIVKINKDEYVVVNQNDKPHEFHESMLPMMIEFEVPIVAKNRSIALEYKKIKVKCDSYDEIITTYKKYKIFYHIYLDDSYLHLEKIPLKVRHFINKVNKDLHKRCNDIQILFDYCYKIDEPFHSLKLCLLYKNKCISNVYYHIMNKDLFEMDLYTLNEHQRKQYNILLCSIGIMISPFYNLSNLDIDARSPITLYMFVKYFNCEYDHSFKKILGDRNVTMEICNEYFEKVDQIILHININDENLNKAKKLYENLLEKDSKLKCP